MSQTKSIITWEDILLGIQYQSILPKVDYIVAIARGGLIPATILSYKLKTNKLLTITTELYHPETNDLNKNLKIKYPLSAADISRLTNAESILIVDDILDSGETLAAVETYFKTVIPKCPELHFFTICKKSSASKTVPEIFYKTISPRILDGDDWIVFPWDEEYLDYTEYRDIHAGGKFNGQST